MEQKKTFSNLEEALGIKFNDPSLLQTAFTHRSYLNEHPEYKNPSNERLEFLGDAVLQFLTSEHLFRNYPNSPEGDLTNFRAATVNTTSLSEESRRLGFGSHLLLSKGEEESGGREKDYILANTFEALLGAIYLDQGIATCRGFLEKNLFYKIIKIIKSKAYKDYKSSFQEVAQEKKGITPTYKVLAEWGPDHAKQFRIGVFLGKDQCGVGEGSSKQRAEEEAAKNALDKFKI